MKIPLFDIDGTLLEARDPLHRKAFNYSFEKIYNQPPRQNELNTNGMTDRQIIVEVLKIRGISPQQARKKIETAMRVMVEFFNAHKQDLRPIVLPGVFDLLSDLKNMKTPLGLLTGNVEGIGWTRLGKAGLRDFFGFGAFGDKTEIRAELVEIARKNAEMALNKKFQVQDFVIIGDSPKDIFCAKEAKVQIIAVSSCISSFEELEKESPDLLVHSLEEKDKILDFLTTSVERDENPL
ncbi:MAG: hypothetical protein A2W22_01270 [Candidatus Levybacteria bacterium RBG_16_35_11]|nr:MAG: hypothetical protein A2W22_01270 [Candidatus Levybacteria bacterium RBG_16_35_11]